MVFVIGSELNFNNKGIFQPPLFFARSLNLQCRISAQIYVFFFKKKYKSLDERTNRQVIENNKNAQSPILVLDSKLTALTRRRRRGRPLDFSKSYIFKVSVKNEHMNASLCLNDCA